MMDQMSDNSCDDSNKADTVDNIAGDESSVVLDVDNSDRQLSENSDQMVTEVSDEKRQKSVKKVVKISDEKCNKGGILFISYIPMGLNVPKIRQLLSEYGEVERIFLQKDNTHSTKRSSKRSQKKKSNYCRYVEGWVEFKRKSVAKMVANLLNGKQIGGKRRAKYYDQMWSLKYLHKFKWSHLAEQLSYEKALTQQKLRFEISRAKKETSFYEQMSMKSKFNSKNKTKNDDNDGGGADGTTGAAKRPNHYKQRKTDEMIRKNKASDNGIDFELLGKIFQ